MFKHAWSIVVASSVVNAEDNSMSLFNVMEGIEVAIKDPKVEKSFKTSKKLALSMPHEVVSYLYRQDDAKRKTIDMRLEFKTPSGAVTTVLKQKVVFEPKVGNMRTRIKSAGFQLTEPGLYYYNIYIPMVDKDEEQLVASLPLTVTFSSKTKG